MDRLRAWILTCHSLALRLWLMSTSSVILDLLSCEQRQQYSLTSQALRGVNGSKHMKVIYKLGSSRKCQSRCDVFIFSQLLIRHTEFICVPLSCFSWVPALLFQQVVHELVQLILCQFVCSSTHPPTQLPTHHLPPTHLFSYLPLHSPTHLFSHPPLHSPIHLFIRSLLCARY